jgi:hypothetical protein
MFYCRYLVVLMSISEVCIIAFKRITKTKKQKEKASVDASKHC